MIRIALQKPYNIVGLEENYFMRNNLESCFLKKNLSYLFEIRIFPLGSKKWALHS